MSDAYTLTLPESFVDDTLTMAHADLLAEVTKQPASITVNAGSVEVIKTPGVQLLLWLQHTAKAQNIPFSVESPSDYFNRFCNMLGAKTLLNTPLNKTAN